MATVKSQTQSDGVLPQSISISGYKSLRNVQAIEIRPLTILAGANSSGKSSLIQPLLLLKQTLEVPYDPGPLLLDGPNVKFTEAAQLFFKGKGHSEEQFKVELNFYSTGYALSFNKGKKSGLEIGQAEFWESGNKKVVISPKIDRDYARSIAQNTLPYLNAERIDQAEYQVERVRCFLQLTIVETVGENKGFVHLISDPVRPQISNMVRSLIHVPGLRGNPARHYAVSAFGETFPGTFENYAASVIALWQNEESEKIDLLSQQLEILGLTWKVEARRVDDTKVELRVGRTKRPARGGGRDLVSVADVGFGVSQTLPVLVALLAARPGQMVYIEQPEIHLHPRAQVAMAHILADAALRGVRVIAETHSALLLRETQTLVAEGKLSSDLIKLHWFTRDEKGETRIESTNLSHRGTFGTFPLDFSEVELDAESRFLNAAGAVGLKGQ